MKWNEHLYQWVSISKTNDMSISPINSTALTQNITKKSSTWPHGQVSKVGTHSKLINSHAERNVSVYSNDQAKSPPFSCLTLNCPKELSSISRLKVAAVKFQSEFDTALMNTHHIRSARLLTRLDDLNKKNHSFCENFNFKLITKAGIYFARKIHCRNVN